MGEGVGLDLYYAAAQYKCSRVNSYVVALGCSHVDSGEQPSYLAAAVAGREGGSVEVFDLAQFRCIQTLSGPHAGEAAADLAFHRKQPSCMVSCGADGTVKLWDLRTGNAVPQRTLHTCETHGAVSVSVSAGDCFCAYAFDTNVCVLDLASGKVLFTHEEAHSEPVSCLRFHPEREHELVSAGDDGLVCALDVQRCMAGGAAVEDDAGLRLLVNMGESIRTVGFAGKDYSVVTAISTAEVLQLWSFHDERAGVSCGRFEGLRSDPRLHVGESDGYVVDVLYDRASGTAQALAGAVDGNLALFHVNLEAAECQAVLPRSASKGASGHTGVVRVVAPLAWDGGPQCGFVTGGEDGRICLWSAGAGSLGGNHHHKRREASLRRPGGAKKRTRHGNSAS